MNHPLYTDLTLEGDSDRVCSAVLEASRRYPILVDFWAPWCASSRLILPVLVRLAEEMAGHLRLLRINVDFRPDLPGRLGATGVPHVALLRGGSTLDHFIGALPESKVRDFLARHLPDPVEDSLLRGRSALRECRYTDAVTALRSAVLIQPEHHGARCDYVIALARAGHFEEARQELQPLLSLGERNSASLPLSRLVDAIEVIAQMGQHRQNLPILHALPH